MMLHYLVILLLIVALGHGFHWILIHVDKIWSQVKWGKYASYLTHWGRMMDICISNVTIIGSDNGLSPARHQAIIWTNAGILLIGPLGTKFSEILIEILSFSFKQIHLKVSSAKWLNVLSRPQCVKFQCFFLDLILTISLTYNNVIAKIQYKNGIHQQQGHEHLTLETS